MFMRTTIFFIAGICSLSWTMDEDSLEIIQADQIQSVSQQLYLTSEDYTATLEDDALILATGFLDPRDKTIKNIAVYKSKTELSPNGIIKIIREKELNPSCFYILRKKFQESCKDKRFSELPISEK